MYGNSKLILSHVFFFIYIFILLVNILSKYCFVAIINEAFFLPVHF